MAITAWNPDTVVSRGNIKVGVTATIADITKPTATELNKGLLISCATTGFNASSSPDTAEIEWLCSATSETITKKISHTLDDLTIKINPTDSNSNLFDIIKQGNTVYVWREDGGETGKSPTSGKRVWVWKTTVGSVDPTGSDNDFIGIVAHFNVLDRTDGPVSVGT